MKRLEFKSILSRFQEIPENQEEADVRSHFQVVADVSSAEQVLEQAAAASLVGAQLIIGQEDGKKKSSGRGRIAGLTLCFGKEDSYFFPAEGFLTGEYLAGKLETLCSREMGMVWVLDLKSQLPFLNLSWGCLLYTSRCV